ncbi:hypothetical protein LSCM1_03698 [Leishmania martiniquensis]|uniref:LRRK2 ARM repeat domain-containing protein n=1 Tax=Leishmania martiniquensis TaxID=1580590 RepID=A0A836GHL4_9TRYP|nr:hypothetical protein LSCM1_03698 [Leishmania martiniquensis]
MEGVFDQIVRGSPMQQIDLKGIDTPEYTIMCAQTPDVASRVKILLNRLQTSTESSAAQNASLLLRTCVSSKLSPDEVEEMVESVAGVARQHTSWPEFARWACALIHYYCTDDFTVSLFSEFEVPKVAVDTLRNNLHDCRSVLAAATLLSYFNLYDIGDGITQLTNVLRNHCGNATIVRIVTRALAEFTSFYKELPNRFRHVTQEFVDAKGVAVLEDVLRDHISDEEITTYAARIAANVTSSGAVSMVDTDSTVTLNLADALARYQQSEMLCGHVLRVFSNIPRSRYIDWDCVSSLFNNTRSELVILECIHFLRSVAINMKEIKERIYTTGCVPRLLETMRVYKENTSIQEEACSLLSYLSFDSAMITGSITRSGGVLLVLEAMRRFHNNEDILIAACAALSGLTFNNQAGQQVVSDNDGVTLILGSMHRGKKARLQENGCLAIGTICWNSDLKADVVRKGGVRLIMRALEEHYTSPGLVKNACRALAQLAFNCEAYRNELNAKEVIPLIIRGMAQHRNYDRAQLHGCVALSYLSWTNENNAAQIRANSGYKAILDAMRSHPNNHEVQEHACRALANISNVSLEDSAAALELIVAAMRRHDSISSVQEEACRAIVTLSLVSPSNKDRLYDLLGADAVMEAMKRFPRVALVQQEACNALAHLAYEHSNLNGAVTRLGGVLQLLTAMRLHRENAKVQLNACAGLSALAFDNTVVQQQIFESSGVQLIIYAMGNVERLRMLELGCSVLGTLAWNADIKERIAASAIPAILKVMCAHENNALLQKSACRAISQFAFNSERNRQLLASSDAIPLIVKAMRTHLRVEKLILHGLKALTYLCWENTQVAEAIIKAGAEEALRRAIQYYPPAHRAVRESVHLCKILFRKTTGGPGQSLCSVSPLLVSPVPIQQTPGPRVEKREPPSPPHDLLGDRFYSAPLDGPYETPCNDNAHPCDAPAHDDCGVPSGGRGDDCCRGGGGERGGEREIERGGRRDGSGEDTAIEVGSNEGLECGGDENSANLMQKILDMRFGRRPNCSRRDDTRGGPRGAGNLWDDPDPDLFHGNRHLGQRNWQHSKLTARSNPEVTGDDTLDTTRGGGVMDYSPHHYGRGGLRRYGGFRGRGRHRGTLANQ